MTAPTSELKVMISLNVATGAESARVLKRFLQGLGCNDVWVCTDSLRAGEDFRDAITSAVKQCDVMILLMTEAWAKSGECKDEYSYARRLNLTSHEKGVTAPNRPRKPLFIPIAFPDLNWEHPHVELLSSTINFLICPEEVLTGISGAVVLESLARSLQSAGFDINFVGNASSSVTMTTQPTAGTSSASDTLAQVTQLLSSVQLSVAALEHRKRHEAKTPFEDKSYLQPRILRERYFGVDTQRISGGHAFTQMEMVVHRKVPQESKSKETEHALFDVDVSIHRVLIHVDDPKDCLDWLKAVAGLTFEEKSKGTFNVHTGLLALSAYELVCDGDPRWALQKYRLVANKEGDSITGVMSQENWTQGVLELQAY